MKDVPSTERMVLCSKRWKLMTQKEKDMFQKRCEQVGAAGAPPRLRAPAGLTSASCPRQKKKQYDVDLQRFLEVRAHLRGRERLGRSSPAPTFSVVFQSLPEEERERVMTEEKMCGSRVAGGVASSPHRARSPVKVPQPPLRPCWVSQVLSRWWTLCLSGDTGGGGARALGSHWWAKGEA